MSEAGEGTAAPREGLSRFGALLLGYRAAAGLTQEELAAAAGVSVRALSNLERGRAKAAQRRSAQALADALGLTGAERGEFLSAARTARQRPATRRAAKAAAPLRRGLCAPPAEVADFVNRAGELAQIRAWARAAAEAPSGVVVSVVGSAGAGKTSFAAAAIRRLAEEFADGCLAVDLRGMDEAPLAPSVALDRMLRALGLDAGDVPHSVAEQSGLFRALLAGRRLLLLLDNASDENQVRPLLAAERGCLTIVTCRRALAGLEGARWLPLAPLPTPHAVDLVARIADARRVGAEPEAANELVALCGNLPLAVRIAGNRLARQPQWRISSLVAELRDEGARLSVLTAGDLQVRSAFAVSYQRLSPVARRTLRRLALTPGVDFGVEVAAVVTGEDEVRARARLEELADATLVQPAAEAGRYQFHDLIRIFATERLLAEEPADERERAASDVDTHLLATASHAARLFYPVLDPAGGGRFGSREQAGEWLRQESSNWLAAARRARAAGRWRELATLARAMHWYSDMNQLYPWVEVFGYGVQAAQALGDQREEAALLNFLGWAQHYCQDDLETGLATHRRALATAVRVGDEGEEAWALTYIATVLGLLGRHEEAFELNERAVALFTKLDDRSALRSARNREGRILRMLGRHEEALAAHQAVLESLARDEATMEPGIHRFHRSIALRRMADVHHDAGRWTVAAACYHEAGDLLDAREVPRDAAALAVGEGAALRLAGEPAAAVRRLRFALTLYADVAARWWRARTLAELALAFDDLGDAEAARTSRDEALALCAELDTAQARALAAELSEVDGPSA